MELCGEKRNQEHNQSSAVNHNIITHSENFFAPLRGEENTQDETEIKLNDFDPAKIDKRNITIRRKKKVNYKSRNRGIQVNQHPDNISYFYVIEAR